jgi:hypothetical protein
MRNIDAYEQLAKAAMFNRYANNAKSAKENKMFDANLARKRLLEDSDGWKDSREMEFSLDRYRKAREAMKGYLPTLK